MARLSDVELWWPRGSGPASLYDATVAIVDSHGSRLAARAARIGLRTVRLQRTDVTDENGGEFAFIINGRLISGALPAQYFDQAIALELKRAGVSK